MQKFSRKVGSYGETNIDALILTEAGLKAPQERRSEVFGNTSLKWGEVDESDFALTYSFVEPLAAFPDDYPPGYATDLLPLPENVKFAYRAAFSAWSDVTSLEFRETNDATAPGDIRIGATLSHPNFSDGQDGAEAGLPGIGTSGDIWHSAASLDA